MANEYCAEDWYCYFHDCSVETGICLKRPTDCREIWDPVCSCFDVTYANACFAAQDGQSIAHEGECEDNRKRLHRSVYVKPDAKEPREKSEKGCKP